MRIASPGFLVPDDVGQKVGGHAAELMILAVEVGLIHGESVDQMLDLVVGVGAQGREIRLERRRSGGDYPLGKTTVDVVSLVVVKQHSGAAIKKFAEPPDLLLRNGDSTRYA